jgi:DNA-binding transcriptional LysR family regulator
LQHFKRQSINRGYLAPKGLTALFASYPDLAVEIAASESPSTIIEDSFDLAIHSGELPDSTFVTQTGMETLSQAC